MRNWLILINLEILHVSSGNPVCIWHPWCISSMPLNIIYTKKLILQWFRWTCWKCKQYTKTALKTTNLATLYVPPDNPPTGNAFLYSIGTWLTQRNQFTKPSTRFVNIWVNLLKMHKYCSKTINLATLHTLISIIRGN